MGLIKFIFWTSLSIVFLYLTIQSAQNLMQDYEAVDKAEKEYEAARAEMYNIKANCEVTERNADGRAISWVCP